MFKGVVFVTFVAVLAHKFYRYYEFMGYSKLNSITDFETGVCSQKFENISQDEEAMKNEFKMPIINTLDADLLPNGLSIFLSGKEFPILHQWFTFNQSDNGDSIQNKIFMLDMNYADSQPFSIKIFNKDNVQVDANRFNLFALSAFEDSSGVFKLLAANFFKSSNDNQINYRYTIEKFVYDGQKHRLVHKQSYNHGLEYGQLCDVVAIDDSLFYFTKCFANSYYNELKFSTESNSGEIWLYDLNENVVYLVAKSIFIPKSIGYLRANNLIAVTNLGVDGLTLYKREFDNSLTKLQDIRLSTFVFNIYVDFSDDLWLTSHPVLHQTLSLANSSFTSPSEFVHMKLDLRYSQLIKTTHKNILYSTNGSSVLNAMSAGISFKKSYILFSLLNDPRVCKI